MVLYNLVDEFAAILVWGMAQTNWGSASTAAGQRVGETCGVWTKRATQHGCDAVLVGLAEKKKGVAAKLGWLGGGHFGHSQCFVRSRRGGHLIFVLHFTYGLFILYAIYNYSKNVVNDDDWEVSKSEGRSRGHERLTRYFQKKNP
jgi:hypothetical protein